MKEIIAERIFTDEFVALVSATTNAAVRVHDKSVPD